MPFSYNILGFSRICKGFPEPGTVQMNPVVLAVHRIFHRAEDRICQDSGRAVTVGFPAGFHWLPERSSCIKFFLPLSSIRRKPPTTFISALAPNSTFAFCFYRTLGLTRLWDMLTILSAALCIPVRCMYSCCEYSVRITSIICFLGGSFCTHPGYFRP